MREINKSFIIGALSSFYIYIVCEIFSLLSKTNNKTTVVILLVIITFFLVYLINFIYFKLYEIEFFRAKFDFRSSYEGNWILLITTDQNDRYGIASLSYDKKSEKYCYQGKTYDSEYKEIANFKTDDLFFDENNKILYTYSASNLISKNVSSGLGRLTFSVDPNGELTNVNDVFVSLTSQSFSTYSCKLIRFPKSFYKDLSNKTDIEKIKILVKEYGDK